MSRTFYALLSTIHPVQLYWYLKLLKLPMFLNDYDPINSDEAVWVKNENTITSLESLVSQLASTERLLFTQQIVNKTTWVWVYAELSP